MATIRIVKSDDWVEVFVDGEQFTEGHSYSTEALLERLGHTVNSEYVDRCEWCCEPFPEGSLKANKGVCEDCKGDAS